GASPELCPAHPGVFQEFTRKECHFMNGTEKVRFVDRYIYNRQQYAHFDSDVGHYVGDTPFGEKHAQYLNSKPEILEYARTAVDWYCRHNYGVFSPFSVERRASPSLSQSTPSLSQ
ncbi:HB2J protein, partial [Thryothorus ludovicianus]|nr:HB2J protein [Thryothorus ludovicianus]